MKPALSLFVIVAGLLLMWACAAVRVNTPPDKHTRPVPFTPEVCDRVTEGMSYEEVINFLGKPSSQSEDKSPKTGRTQTTAFWTDCNGSNVMCKFVNGALATKVVDPLIYHATQAESQQMDTATE